MVEELRKKYPRRKEDVKWPEIHEITKEREEARDDERRIEREKALEIAKQLSPAIERSKFFWPNIQPIVEVATMPIFSIIASHIKEAFICAGSYPAAMLASA